MSKILKIQFILIIMGGITMKKILLKGKKGVKLKENKVPCPSCSNGRLMDMKSGKEVELEIKCPCCKSIIGIYILGNEIFTVSI